MLAEWTAECADDSPSIIVPWDDEASGLRFINLRAEPFDIVEISEAERYPALNRALRSLNATRSPLLTSKCDAWPLAGEELEANALELDGFVSEEHPRAGFGSYIDIVPRERALFLSAHRLQTWLDRAIRRIERIENGEARCTLTMRPAVYHDDASLLEGYAITLYIFAMGADPATAERNWELALEDTVATLRGREFEIPRASATIDAA